MSKKEHTILVEKYRPNTLMGFICRDEYRQKFEEFINKQDIPHILLAGKPGSGKTTLAKLLVNNIDCDYLYINATDERSIDVMRDKVGSFAAAGSFKPLKIVILDEATHILSASQVLLLNMIETYSLTTRFILTGNYPERLIEPLRSRLQEFDLLPPSKKIIAEHVVNILDIEEIKYNIEDIATIVNKFYPDFRKIINNCQKYIVNDKLVLNSAFHNSEEYIDLIIKILAKPDSKSFNNIRQLIADSDVSNFEDIYKALYDRIEEYGKGNEGLIIINIEEGLYHSNFVIDKEINFCAYIYKILEILK